MYAGIIYYMGVIKVSFKGKNILFGKHITTLGQIEQELEARFPGQLPHGVVVSYQGIVLKSLEELSTLAPRSVTGTAKLEAEPASQKMVSVQQKEEASKEDTERPSEK